MAIVKRISLLLLVGVPVLFTMGCNDLGKVEQGRVIAFDGQKGLVTVIRDSSGGADKPSYDALPPATIRIPMDAKEMGPEPEAGKRLLFDPQNKKLVVFDSVSGTIKTIIYTPVSESANIPADDKRVKGVRYPVIDREKKTITIYSSRDKKLVTFTVADEYFALPDDTWQAGDDVRYYFKQPGQALRMMNVTKTNVMKA